MASQKVVIELTTETVDEAIQIVDALGRFYREAQTGRVGGLRGPAANYDVDALAAVKELVAALRASYTRIRGMGFSEVKGDK